MSASSRNQRGLSVVEVLIALALTGLIIVSTGSALGAIHRVQRVSTAKSQALLLAQDSLEKVIAIQQDAFACHGASGLCTRADGQTCTTNPGYTSCWTVCPINIPTPCSATVQHLVSNGSSWQFAVGSETVSQGPGFSRGISLSDIGGNPDQKKVTVSVSWFDQGAPKTTQLSTMLTGWKNVP